MNLDELVERVNGHTPQPWNEWHDADGDFEIAAGPKLIAITDKDSDEDQANARLIASAPDLLSLAEELETEIARLRAELAKRDDGYALALEDAAKLCERLANDADDRIDHGLARNILELAALKVRSLGKKG